MGVLHRFGKLTITRSNIHNNASTGVYQSGGHLAINDSQVYRNGLYGVASVTSDITTTFRVNHNTIVYNKDYGVYTLRYDSRPNNVTITNNIIARNGSTSVEEVYQRNLGGVCENNLIWDGASTKLTYRNRGGDCRNMLSYNPLFVAPAKNDFRIYDRSPARKKAFGGKDYGANQWSQQTTNILHGYLYKDLTLQKGTYTIPGDLYVARGVTLTLAAGVVLQFAQTDDMAGGSSRSMAGLLVEGELKITGSATQKVILRQGTSAAPRRTPWSGVLIQRRGKLTLTHTQIFNASDGIYNLGSATLQHLEIAYGGSAVHTASGTTTLRTSKLHHNNGSGIQHDGGSVDVSNTEIYRNSSYGIQSTISTTLSTLKVDRSTIAYNGNEGIRIRRYNVRQTKATITNNIIVRNGTSNTYQVHQENDGGNCQHNLLWNGTSSKLSFRKTGPDCRSTTPYRPLFLDPAKDDFRLYNRSPARKKGLGGIDLGANPWTTHKTNILHGSLYTDTTLKAGTYNIPGDLIVEKGVTLTLAPGTILQFTKGDDMAGSYVRYSELRVFGVLKALGSPTKAVTMRYGTSDVGTPYAWYGVYVGKSGDATLQHTTLISGYNGLQSEGKTIITDSDIAYHYNDGIQVLGGTAKLLRVKLHHNRGHGLLQVRSDVSITYCQIYLNGKDGLHSNLVTSSSKLFADHNTIVENGGHGIHLRRSSVQSGSATLQNNLIAQNKGYEIYQENYGSNCRNNLAWDTTGSAIFTRYSPRCVSTVTGNPLFVDKTKQDYHLLAASPARGKATDRSDLGALPFVPALFRLSLIPSTAKALTGQKILFKAQGFDKAGNAIPNLSFTWKVVKGGGTIDSKGLLTVGTKTGTFTDTVEVSVGKVKAYASLIVSAPPPKVATVAITPNGGTLKPSETLRLRASAKDPQGKTVSGQRFTWSLTKGGGTLIPSSGLGTQATFRAGTTQGRFTIVAKTGAVSASMAVTINDPKAGKLARIELKPKSARVDVKKSVQFSATGYDVYNKVVSRFPVVWSVSSGAGSISNKGLFTAGAKAGSFTVTALSGSVRVTASVIVVDPKAGKLARIVVSPNSATIKAQDTLQFGAKGYDANNKLVPNFRATWVVSGGGSIDSKGLFTAGSKAGSFTITASSGSIKGTAQVKVTANNAPSAPRPKSPSDGATTLGSTVTLVVSNATDADGDALTYHFQLSSSKGFSGKVEEQKSVNERRLETSWTPRNLKTGTTYYWRVRAYDGQAFSTWSKVWRFTSKAKQAETTQETQPEPQGERSTEAIPTPEPIETTESNEPHDTIDDAGLREATNDAATKESARSEAGPEAQGDITNDTNKPEKSDQPEANSSEVVSKESANQVERETRQEIDEAPVGGCACEGASSHSPFGGLGLCLLLLLGLLRRRPV